jgi:hypothetical protein
MLLIYAVGTGQANEARITMLMQLTQKAKRLISGVSCHKKGSTYV